MKGNRLIRLSKSVDLCCSRCLIAQYRRTQAANSLTPYKEIMTRINHLRVSGFKAIDELEVNAKEINLITGRNNMGKTSLLESLDLVFNPRNIGHFSENLDKVIHEDSSSASIDCEFRKRQQTLASFSEDSTGEHREIGLRKPNPDEVIRYFSEIVEEILDLNEDYPIRISNSIITKMETEDAETYKDDLQEILREGVAEISEERILSKMSNNLIVLEIEGETYPYIHLGDSFSQLRNTIVQIAIEKLYDWIDLRENSEKEQHQRELRHGFRSMLAPRFGGSRFVGEQPPEIGGVHLVKDPTANPDKMDLNQENTAVRTSDIEEYLKENKIVKNMEDFSFDRLVFQEDDEKDEVPYAFMGSGFKTIVGILWELFDQEKEGDVLLFEESDVHMHPGYVENLLRQLIEISRKKDLQLFITTHNVDMIEGFFSPTLRRTHGEYLEDSFQLIQLSGKIPKTLNYDQAGEEVEEVNSDLRGI